MASFAGCTAKSSPIAIMNITGHNILMLVFNCHNLVQPQLFLGSTTTPPPKGFDYIERNPVS